MQPNSDVIADGNFLLPNGTFFAVLIIFLIVLGVIRAFVVPPIRAVLDERERRAARTAQDNRDAAAAFADAEQTYRAELTEARGEASKIREQARAEGIAIIERMRAEAKSRADAIAAQSEADLRAEGDRIAARLRAEVGPLAQTLADRVLGVEGQPVAGGAGPTGRG